MAERAPASTPSDQDLVAATLAGDRNAFEELVVRHRDAAYGLALHFLRNPEEADEAAQEAFVRAYELLSRYDSAREFGPWLKGIAVKVCSEMRRKRRHVPDDEARKLEPISRGETDSRDTALVVREALRELPDKYRIPLVMFYLDEASVIDVAYALSLSPVAVRVRLHRGRAMLSKKLSTTFGGELRLDALQDSTTSG